jgi:hypothetical protein
MANLTNFYPNVYIKAGTGIATFTTVAVLEAALSAWTWLSDSEAGAEMKNQKGREIESTKARKKQLSTKIDGMVNFLECTEANYDYLRANFNGKDCSILMYDSVMKVATQIDSVNVHIGRDFKSGDVIRIKITFTFESGDKKVTINKLT